MHTSPARPSQGPVRCGRGQWAWALFVTFFGKNYFIFGPLAFPINNCALIFLHVILHNKLFLAVKRLF